MILRWEKKIIRLTKKFAHLQKDLDKLFPSFSMISVNLINYVVCV